MLGGATGIWSDNAAPPGAAVAALFSGGDGGIWLDPSDLSTLFQDAAGSIPVASAGDPVGLMLDKSGNGNHVTAATDAARPIYQTSGGLHWIEGDGVDDELATTAPLPFSANLFHCSAFRALSYSAPFPHIVSHRGAGVSDSSQRQPLLFITDTVSDRVLLHMGLTNLAVDLGYDVLGSDIVVSGHTDGTGAEVNINSQVRSGSSGGLVDGGLAGFAVLGPNNAHARFYGTVQLNRIPAGAEIAAVRYFFARKSGGIA